MESSASSAPQNAKESELEQVRSDLHALKILYGLLRNRENDSENTLRETEDWLDERSRAFLVRLLDEATQRALRRQAKMLSSALLPPSPDLARRRRLDQGSDSAVEEVAVLDHLRECHRSEDESSTAGASPSQGPGPPRDGLRLSKRLESRRSVLSQDGSKHGHDRPIRRDLHGPAIDPSPETRKDADHVITPVDQRTREQDLRPIAITKHAAVAIGYNSGEPAHKRSRLESEDGRPGRTPSRVRTDRRTERELSRVFTKERRVKERAERRPHGAELNDALHVRRRSGSLKDGRLEEPGSPCRRPQISQPEKRADDQGKPEGKEIVKLSSRRSRLAAPGEPPSREEVRADRVKTSRELGRRSSRLVEREDKRNEGTTDGVGPSRTKRPPIKPSKMRSNRPRYSPSSGSTTGSSPGTTSATESQSSTRSADERLARTASASARNSKHRGEVPRRAVGLTDVPRRQPAGPGRAAPTGRRMSEETRPRRRRPPEAADPDHEKKAADQREGRLRRLRNKLAIVFHHQHHHHHHHHHPGHVDVDSSSQEEDGPHRREHHHKRSPWRYLRRILHRAGDEEDRGRGRKPAMEVREERAAGKVVPAHHQHGNVRALFEALLRHLWGARRRRRRKPVRQNRPGAGRSASRLRLRKLHWWQRVRRRGGVKLANSKKTPLSPGRN